MATGKRYYWIKLRESFMTSDTVDFLMSQKDGANYVVLYQMLCLKTINTGGRLSRTIGEIVIPYNSLIVLGLMPVTCASFACVHRFLPRRADK